MQIHTQRQGAVSPHEQELFQSPLGAEPALPVEQAERPVGWEYDDMFMAYRDHPQNNELVRFKRDFDGFVGKPPKSAQGNALTSEPGGLFIANANRFCLLDGFSHEKALKETIDTGKAAYQELQRSNSLTPWRALYLEHMAIQGAGAYQTMYESNLRLVTTIANRMVPRDSAGYQLDDLQNNGSMGLRRAVQLFDPEKGCKFSTYASNWIKQYIQRGRLQAQYPVVLNADAERKMRRVSDMVTESKSGNEKWPTQDELKKAGIVPEIATAAQNWLKRPTVALDAPVSADGSISRGDLIAAPPVDFDSGLDAEANRDLLESLLKNAGVRVTKSRLVLSLREGVFLEGIDYKQVLDIPGHEGEPLEDVIKKLNSQGAHLGYLAIGKVLGVTREHARRLAEDAKHSILFDHSMGLLTEKLNLQPAEIVNIRRYVTAGDYNSANGRRNAYRSRKEQQETAEQAVALLSDTSLDLPYAADETVRIFKERSSQPNSMTPSKIGSWLAARFTHATELQKYIVTYGEARKFGLTKPTARLSDVTYVAVLSGAWGKVPR